MSDCDRPDQVQALTPVHAHAVRRHLPAGHGHRIIGRITRHSLPQRETLRRVLRAREGCHKVPLGHPGALPRGRPVSVAGRLHAIPALSTAVSVAGGSGVLGGFGGDGVAVAPDGSDGCAGLWCQPGIVLPEPASVALLVSAVMVFVAIRRWWVRG